MFEKTKEYIKVMQAAVEGKKIETRYINGFIIQEWQDVISEPDWNFKLNEFRVKPEPKVVPFEHLYEVEPFLDKQVIYIGWTYKLVAISNEHVFLAKDYSKNYVDSKFTFKEAFENIKFTNGDKFGRVVIENDEYPEDIPF